MNPFEAFVDGLAHGIEFLAHFDRQALIDAGAHSGMVVDWDKAHEVYFGPTNWTKQQRRAVELARSRQVSLDKLVLIEKRIRHIEDAALRWRLRHELLQVRGSYDTLKRRAKEIVPEAQQGPPKKGMRFSRSRQGMRSMTVTAEEGEIAAVEFAVTRNLDPQRPVAPQMADAFIGALFGAGAGEHEPSGQGIGGEFQRRVPRPIIVVPLSEHIAIMNGEGEETILGLSDGTTMTGAEYLERFHGGDVGPGTEVALFHPQHGPVNLYRGSRRPNAKQRDLLRMTNTVCPVPGCRQCADVCEVHHIEAWKHGGETNLANLAMVCRYHNRTNNDDPYAAPRAGSRGRKVRRRGRVENLSGRRRWISPRGHPVANDLHPFDAMTVSFGEPARS